MEGDSETAVTIVGFRKLQRPGGVSEKAAVWGLEEQLVNLVILEFGCSAEEKKRLKEVELWARGLNHDIRLSRILKQEAFLQSYKEAASSPLKTYFLTCLSIEQISKEPLQTFYQQHSSLQASLEDLNRKAQTNLQRIAFIILKDKLESIDKRNYFHANVALITSEVALIQQLLQENLKILIKLRPANESSSINSEQAENFERQLEAVGMQLPVYESELSSMEQNDRAAMKLLHNSPGVGTYNIQGHRN